jgi:hypothetical protein
LEEAATRAADQNHDERAKPYDSKLRYAMIVIGLLLLVFAAAFGIDLVWKNNFHITNPTVFGQSLGIHSAASLFVTGAITGAAVLVGIALLFAGMRRKGTKAVSGRRARKEALRLREDRDKLRSENAQLHSELDHRDAGAITTTPDDHPVETTDQPEDV